MQNQKVGARLAYGGILMPLGLFQDPTIADAIPAGLTYQAVLAETAALLGQPLVVALIILSIAMGVGYQAWRFLRRLRRV